MLKHVSLKQQGTVWILRWIQHCQTFILFINLSSFIDEPPAERHGRGLQRDLVLCYVKAKFWAQRVCLRSLDVALDSITHSNQIFPG